MATISLNANKINQMPSLIKDVKQSVTDYKSELAAIKNKTLTINRSICNLDDVISSIQTSTQIQEQKIASLDTFSQNSEEFIAVVVRIDSNVADIIKQRKDQFYGEYSFLKPDSEKNGWEIIKDRFESASEWCEEHWNQIVTSVIIIIGAVLAIVAIIITGGVALVPLFATVLTVFGVSAGAAMTIATYASFFVAAVAFLSTIVSSGLNIMDTWGDIDNPTFNAWQTAMNWISMLSNGLYSIGSLFNSFKGISIDSLRAYSENWINNSSFRSAIAGADNFNFMVQPDSATFWAGLGRDGENIAREYATSVGRTTLESTLDTQGITRPLPTDTAGWNQASSSYAMRSSGSVQGLFSDAVGTLRTDNVLIGNTWLNYESVLLNINSRVTSFNNISRVFDFSSFLSSIFSGGETAINAANKD